ncbi:MAG: type II toxin-antitoxin system RelE/ParE family toxin [Alphaproteobacteria bacterium]|nr:type II toxin-antitoxin system RelE/ParE family toxin [Alphaproteobacteria bacterium]
MEIIRSEEFERWFCALRSREVRLRIAVRIFRMEQGNPGDVKAVGHGLNEVRIHVAGGIRLYFIQQGKTVIILLAGGDKSTQSRDIALAKTLAEQWRNR